MNILIRYRCDEEESYCEDDTALWDTTWEAVLDEIKSIESHATVLEIQRLDID
jgi:hypothetical protein